MAQTTEEQIDWEQVRKQGRAKIIYVGYDELIDYFAVRNGKLAAMHVMTTYDLPERWAFQGSATPIYTHNAVAFIILSPEFDKTPIGGELPELLESTHQVRITREEI